MQNDPPADDPTAGQQFSRAQYLAQSQAAFVTRRDATETLQALHRKIRGYEIAERAALFELFEVFGDLTGSVDTSTCTPEFQQWFVSVYADWQREKGAA